MNKFGEKLRETSPDFSALSKRLTNLKLKLEALKPNNNLRIDSRLEFLEEILDVALDQKEPRSDLPFTQIKELISKFIPDFSVRMRILEELLGVVKYRKSDDVNDISYSELRTYITDIVPKIGNRLTAMEIAFGISDVKKQDSITYLELLELVRQNIPEFGNRITRIEKILKIENPKP